MTNLSLHVAPDCEGFICGYGLHRRGVASRFPTIISSTVQQRCSKGLWDGGGNSTSDTGAIVME